MYERFSHNRRPFRIHQTAGSDHTRPWYGTLLIPIRASGTRREQKWVHLVVIWVIASFDLLSAVSAMIDLTNSLAVSGRWDLKLPRRFFSTFDNMRAVHGCLGDRKSGNASSRYQ